MAYCVPSCFVKSDATMTRCNCWMTMQLKMSSCVRSKNRCECQPSGARPSRLSWIAGTEPRLSSRTDLKIFYNKNIKRFDYPIWVYVPGCGCGRVPALLWGGCLASIAFVRLRFFFGESDLLLGCSRYIYVEGGRKSADAKTNNIYESKRKVFTSRYMKADIKYSPQTNLQI